VTTSTDFPALVRFASHHTRGWAQAQLLDLAAVGLAMQLWRNEGPIERAHIEGHISDPEMMRANAAVTRLLRGQLEELDEEPSSERLRAWSEQTGDLLLRLRLPDGRTTKQAAGPYSRRLAAHGRRRLRTIVQIADEHGWSAVLSLLATGGWAYSRWWLSPRWPGMVVEFVAALQAPEHSHWSLQPAPDLSTAPGRCREPIELGKVLLDGPDRLSAEEAQFCVRCSIEFIRPRSADDPSEDESQSAPA
jgi:hypothetical protein